MPALVDPEGSERKRAFCLFGPGAIVKARPQRNRSMPASGHERPCPIAAGSSAPVQEAAASFPWIAKFATQLRDER